MSSKLKAAIGGLVFLTACGGHGGGTTPHGKNDATAPIDLVDTDDPSVPIEPVAAVAGVCSQLHYPTASTAGGELIGFLVGLNNAALLGRLTQIELVSVYRHCVVSSVGAR